MTTKARLTALDAKLTRTVAFARGDVLIRNPRARGVIDSIAKIGGPSVRGPLVDTITKRGPAPAFGRDLLASLLRSRRTPQA